MATFALICMQGLLVSVFDNAKAEKYYDIDIPDYFRGVEKNAVESIPPHYEGEKANICLINEAPFDVSYDIKAEKNNWAYYNLKPGEHYAHSFELIPKKDEDRNRSPVISLKFDSDPGDGEKLIYHDIKGYFSSEQGCHLSKRYVFRFSEQDKSIKLQD
ncbi:hypothetical protein [Azotobacter chroococcum]|uniref:Uncharacterized protein n=1 Tax=Azotobacter chroococcum TaxID=353 RepID=A0AAP9YGY2_9GAMM|nr:hypothetical protein [Azotobacter chroococcum]QQE91100.1 hypothetical protein GKQ51_23140 [Azotobacter chroococcum]